MFDTRSGRAPAVVAFGRCNRQNADQMFCHRMVSPRLPQPPFLRLRCAYPGGMFKLHFQPTSSQDATDHDERKPKL
jgi:hypothetical protein